MNIANFTKKLAFDTSTQNFELSKGEFPINRVSGVQDIKGNPHEKGGLILTNLRYIFFLQNDRKTNIFIGMEQIVSVTTTQDRKGDLIIFTQKLKARRENSRFQFVFRTDQENNSLIFKQLNQVHTKFITTKLYRDLVLKADIKTSSFRLKKLHNQNIVSEYAQSKLMNQSLARGTLYLTDIRIAFIGSESEVVFSCSWASCQSIAEGPDTMIIQAQGLQFVFVNSKNKIIKKQAQSLSQSYKNKPFLGIENSSSEKQFHKFIETDLEPEQVRVSDGLRRLLVYQSGRESKGRIVFNQNLGLAMEMLPEGYSLQGLWKVLQ